MSEVRSQIEDGAQARAWRDSLPKLRRLLAGDLDDIVLMALRKEPSRRYGSVEQFSEDIRRHLAGLPVIARKGSWRYRSGKFVVRHKVGVAAGFVILLAVAGGVATTIREARIAAANQRRAEQRFNDVRKLANSLMFEIHDAVRDLPGSTPARKLLVSRALEYLDSLSGQSKGDASLQRELAAAYERVGDVLGYPYAANLGDKPGAEQAYRKALALREPLAASASADVDLQRDLVGNYVRLAQVQGTGGDFSGALNELMRAQPIAERLAAGSKDAVLLDHLAGVYYFTGSIQAQTGEFGAALQNYQRSSEIRNAALAANPGTIPLRTHLAADDAGIAQCYEAQNNLGKAIELQSKATAILEDVVRSNPGNATLSEYLGEGTNRLATYRKEHGDTAVALDTYRKAHKIFGDLLKADPKNSLARSNFGFSNNGVGRSLTDLGEAAVAVRVFRESITSFEEMSPHTTSSRYPRTGLADAYLGLGEAYLKLASGAGVSATQRRDWWKQAKTACEVSLTIWKDKEKRGELEVGERSSPLQVGECIATSAKHLAGQ